MSCYRDKARIIRHKRVRKKVFGTSERPRLCVFRSNRNMIAQIVDDTKGITLAYASTNDPELRGAVEFGGNKEAAAKAGTLIAKKAIKMGIKQVVFDRGGYIYHGRVQALADAARKEGLDF